MAILITGATGFIGNNLVRRLIEENKEIIAVVRKNSKNRSKLPINSLIKVVEICLDDYDQIDSYINEQIDVLFHLSWNGTRGQDRMDPILQKQNYVKSVDLVKWAIDKGCKKVFLSGSQAEYGRYDQLVDEQTPCIPTTEYGKEKLNLFNESMKICKKNDATLIEPRYFSVYGVDDNEKTMVISILKKMINNEDCSMTKCEQLWNFLHIDDTIDGLIKLMQNDCASGAYNFGSDDTRRLVSYIQEMKDCSNSTSKLHFGAVDYPSTGMVSINPDISKLKSAIGWEPMISFCEGITKMVSQFRENENG